MSVPIPGADIDAALAADARRLTQSREQQEQEQEQQQGNNGAVVAHSPESRVQPHFALPNQSQTARTYLNREQDIVYESFNPANFRMIQDLPSQLAPDKVLENQRELVQAAMQRNQEHSRKTRVTKNGLFEQFTYDASPYSLVEELRAREQREHAEKQAAISDRPFLPASVHSRLFAETGQNEEEPEQPEHDNDILQLVNASEDAPTRLRWMDKSKILAGPFVPAGVGYQPRKKELDEILHEIEQHVLEDWDEYQLDVYNDEEDMIVLQFQLTAELQEELTGLLAYMNMMSQRSACIVDHRLVRLPELWHHRPGDGAIYYGFRPPWARVARNRSHALLEERRKRATAQQPAE